MLPKASIELNPVADIVEFRVANGTVLLQALGTSGDDRTAVAIVPGLAETAADRRELIEQLAPIPAAAVTLRGRGSSSCPPSGYSLADHASDIEEAFVRSLLARSVVLVAFSRSVAYALEYATARRSKLAGLVLLDYPPRHSELPAEWTPWFAQSIWRGRRADEVLDMATIGAIQAEAAAKDFSSDLLSIAVPTLVIRGAQAGAALSDSDADTYKQSFANCEVITFENSSPHCGSRIQRLCQERSPHLYKESKSATHGPIAAASE